MMALIIAITSSAQNLGYSSDAMVVSQDANTVTIKSSGVHEKKKEAELTAIKSAFYTYLMTGLQGLNNDRPLIDSKKQNDPKVLAIVSSIMNGQYNIYVKSYIADDKVEKTLDKMYKVVVTFELYNEAFIKFLVSNSVIAKSDDKVTLSETNDNMIMPTIMVVPRTEPGETIKNIFDTKSEYRSTASKLGGGFLKEGVETKNFDEVYNGLVMSGALSSYGSTDDQILSEASKGVDVIVYMDIKSNVNANGTSVELALTATDASTKSTIATISESSAYFKNQTVSNLSGLLAETIIPNFMKQISTSFARNLSRGQGISIRIQLDPSSSADLNSDIGSNMLTTGDIMRLWIKKNCKGGRYRIQTQTATLIVYDQIFIKTQDEGGSFSDVNDFELELRQNLGQNGVTISKRLMDGNNIIYTLTL